MEQWEYLTRVIEANIETSWVPIQDDVPLPPHPKYSVYTLIPQLNELGAKGWELLQMEAVVVGKNGDFVPPLQGGKFARHFLCTFKRRRLA